MFQSFVPKFRPVANDFSRSFGSIGLPLRQIMRVLPFNPTRSRISSSISTLSLSAKMTTRALAWFSLAAINSLRMVKICVDQPRISV